MYDALFLIKLNRFKLKDSNQLAICMKFAMSRTQTLKALMSLPSYAKLYYVISEDNG